MVYETSVTYRHFVKAQNVTKWGYMFFKEILSHFTDIISFIYRYHRWHWNLYRWRNLETFFSKKKVVIVISELRAISNIHHRRFVWKIVKILNKGTPKFFGLRRLISNKSPRSILRNSSVKKILDPPPSTGLVLYYHKIKYHHEHVLTKE